MPARTFHGIELSRVEDAVRAAERRTRGEIRVALARFYFWGDVARAARRVFSRLRMDRTSERNGVLIFVVPWRRRFAIVGDVGIDRCVEPRFWDDLARPLSEAFRAGDASRGLIATVGAVADCLAAHFPIDPGAGPKTNQLPDGVAIRST